MIAIPVQIITLNELLPINAKPEDGGVSACMRYGLSIKYVTLQGGGVQRCATGRDRGRESGDLQRHALKTEKNMRNTNRAKTRNVN